MTPDIMADYSGRCGICCSISKSHVTGEILHADTCSKFVKNKSDPETMCPMCYLRYKGPSEYHYSSTCIYYKGCPRCRRTCVSVQHLEECSTLDVPKPKPESESLLRECPDCKKTVHPIFLSIVHTSDCRKSPRLKTAVDGGKIMTPFCVFCSGREGEHYPFCRRRESSSESKRFNVDIKKPLDQENIVSRIQGGSPVSIDGLIMRAAKVAAEAHKDQERKYSRIPYIHHPMRVAGRTMLLMGAGPIEVASAWLHDVLEDTKMTTHDLLDRGIPEAVVTNVHALSNPSRFIKDKPRSERKDLDRKWLSEQSVWVKKIKMIDRIDNMTELDWNDLEFMLLYSRESKLLAQAIGSVDTHLEDELLSLSEYYENEIAEMRLRKA